MPARATIRRAEPRDAPSVHRLICELAAYEKEPEAVVCTPDDLGTQLAGDSPPFQCLLVEERQHIVGFALYFHNYSTWRGRPGIYLEDLFVMPTSRGLGYGRALLSALAKLAVERGCARMEWSVLDWNRPAIEFYRALGAEPQDGWTTFRISGLPLERLADTASGYPEVNDA
ncbi:MAG: GNAT family N-acetyltransferase [Nannocystaceae bacterium]